MAKIDSVEFSHRLYDLTIGSHNKESNHFVRWDSGCWIRYKVVENLLRDMEREAEEKENGTV